MEQSEQYKNSESKNFSLDEFIFMLIKWKKWILISFVVAVLAAVFLSSPVILPPEYKSEIIIYPPSSNGKLLLGYDVYFGVDKEIDEGIQILKSSILRDSLVARYNLLEHYEINSADEHRLSKLYRRFNNNVKIERTRYNSISVMVYDTDPVMAANIANDMVKIGDEVKYSIIKQNLRNIYENTEKENLNQLHVLDTLAKQINSLNKEFFKTNGTNVSETNKLDLLKAQIDIREMIKNTIENKNNALLNLLYTYETKFNHYIDIKESLKDLNKCTTFVKVNRTHNQIYGG